MDYASCRSLPAMFFEVARQHAARPFLWAKHDRTYKALSWSEAAASVSRLARGLAALGIEPGERVALVSENRPEWVVADLAIMSAGAVTVPAYVTNTVADHRHILGNSGARVAIVSTAALAGRVISAAAQVPSVRTVIAIEPPSPSTSALDLRPYLFRRRRRRLGAQSARGAADADDRGAEALRDDAPAHPARDRARARVQTPDVRARRRNRQETPCWRAPVAWRAAPRPGAR